MKLPKSIRRVQMKLAMSMAHFLVFLIKIMPYRFARGIITSIFFLAFPLLIRLRTQIRHTLLTAYEDNIDETTIHKTSWNVLTHLGYNFLNMLYVHLHPHLIDEVVTVKNAHYLDEILENNKGVVAITAHFSNFPLMFMKLAHMGYKVNVVIRQIRHQAFSDFIHSRVISWNVHLLHKSPPNAFYKAAIKALKNNEILFILNDEDYPDPGHVFVNFFKKPAATATGAAQFANRSSQNVLPIFMHQVHTLQYEIVCHPPIAMESKPNHDHTEHQQLVQALTQVIEEQVRQHPEHWTGWLNRRWRTRPKNDKSPKKNISPNRP